MIQLTLNVSNPEDLDKMLDVLDRRGLLSNVVQKNNVCAPSAPVKPADGRGSHFSATHDATRARLAERGLAKQPPASEEERKLREEIDAERAAAGQKAINWKIDLVKREEALADKGYDIYATVDGAEQPQETETNFDISLHEPVA